MNQPKVSVVMPFYNCEQYLDESISSILHQTFSNFEFIIINDASTDESDTIVKKYLHDKRIIYVNNETNIWIVKNLNHGISLAQGQYIARMDGDDISTLDRLEKQVTFLDDHPEIDIVWWSAILINEQWNHIGKLHKPLNHQDILDGIFLYSPFIHPTVLYKKTLISHLWYRQEYHLSEDYDLWCRLLLGWYKSANLSDYVLLYRKHAQSSSQYNRKKEKLNFLIRKQLISHWYTPSFKEKVAMYAHYILWILLTWQQKEFIEKWIKRILYS